MKADYTSHILKFKKKSGTSRGILTTKKSYFIRVTDENYSGIGECGLLAGLSCDDVPNYESILQDICTSISNQSTPNYKMLIRFPSIRMGLEHALLDLKSKENQILFPSAFTQGKEYILINGLIWMGSKVFMLKQIREKLEQGFSCLKLKIGALNFEDEIELLRCIRNEYNAGDLEIRLDANGSFSIDEAKHKLSQLQQFHIHSIEQPIRAGQWESMRKLSENPIIPIALDEELIGIHSYIQKEEILQQIKPQYIILKPSLLGGFAACDEWINCAETKRIGWWITSALESNIGLSAIAQYTFLKKNKLPQGLGTGMLYTNNFESPLYLKGENLFFNPKGQWHFSQLKWT